MWLLIRGCLIKMLGNRQVAHRDMTVTNSGQLVTALLVGISISIYKSTPNFLQLFGKYLCRNELGFCCCDLDDLLLDLSGPRVCRSKSKV